VWRLQAPYNTLLRADVDRFQRRQFSDVKHEPPGGGRVTCESSALENAECMCLPDVTDVACGGTGVVRLLMEPGVTTMRDVYAAACMATERLVLVVETVQTLVHVMSTRAQLPETDLENRIRAAAVDFY